MSDLGGPFWNVKVLGWNEFNDELITNTIVGMIPLELDAPKPSLSFYSALWVMSITSPMSRNMPFKVHMSGEISVYGCIVRGFQLRTHRLLCGQESCSGTIDCIRNLRRALVWLDARFANLG